MHAHLKISDLWRTSIAINLVLSIIPAGQCFVQDKSCGIPGQLALSAFVGGGSVANRKEWPWFVSLRIHFSSDNSSQLCGGSLLTQKHVLTAAHCTHHQRNTAQTGRITATLGKYYFEEYKSTKGQGQILIKSWWAVGTLVLTVSGTVGARANQGLQKTLNLNGLIWVYN